MDWLSFFCGMIAAIGLLFLFFLFLPIRSMEKAGKENRAALEGYWAENMQEQKRQSTALENIAELLLNDRP